MNLCLIFCRMFFTCLFVFVFKKVYHISCLMYREICYHWFCFSLHWTQTIIRRSLKFVSPPKTFLLRMWSTCWKLWRLGKWRQTSFYTFDGLTRACYGLPLFNSEHMILKEFNFLYSPITYYFLLSNLSSNALPRFICQIVGINV